MRRAIVTGPTVTPRQFTDCVGDRWTVYCVIPPAIPERPNAYFPHRDRRSGWLLFESEAGERRRLAPFPDDWHAVSDFELERWCMRATRIEATPQRRAEDRPGRV